MSKGLPLCHSVRFFAMFFILEKNLEKSGSEGYFRGTLRAQCDLFITLLPLAPSTYF
jgi:hypothetical protein